jgi:SAM-dependent methyltransferase
MAIDNRKIYNEIWTSGGGELEIAYYQQSSGARWFRALLGDMLKVLKKEEITSVADIGCGLGINAAVLAQCFPAATVSGFDFAENAVAKASQYWQTRYSNLSFAVEDVTEASFGKSYDLVCLMEVLEHLEDWQGMLDKITDVTDKYLFLTFPTGRMRSYEPQVGHLRNFKKGEVEEYLSRHGFEPIKRYYAGFPFYSPLWRDLQGLFFKEYNEVRHQEMSRTLAFFHRIYYILLRYLSFKHIGDSCMVILQKVRE